MVKKVRVLTGLLALLVEEARTNPREECCGLLAGRAGVITRILTARNTLKSPIAFEIEPAELFRMVRQMREQSLEHLGIYHSHPNGENVPSVRDIERAFYPETAYFILSPREDAALPVRAFLIRNGKVSEITVETVDG